MRLLFALLFLPFALYATVVGNPFSPSLLENGLLSSYRHVSLRGAFFYENMYKGRFKEHFVKKNPESSNINMYSEGGLISLNLFNWVDLYSQVGAAKLHIDQTLITDYGFAWSVGIKSIFWKSRRFAISGDLKYFSSAARADFLLVPVPKLQQEKVANFGTPITFTFEELQCAWGISYRKTYFSPYIGMTYLFTQISTLPFSGVLRFSENGKGRAFSTKDNVGRKHLGLFLGLSLIAKKEFSLSVESRLFDQNSCAIIGDLRF